MAWTLDGTLISFEAAAHARNATLEEIAFLVKRGAFFEVWVGTTPYIPAEFANFCLLDSAAICRALEGQSAASKIFFLRRLHGGLGGMTITAALQSGVPLSRICQLAEASAFV